MFYRETFIKLSGSPWSWQTYIESVTTINITCTYVYYCNHKRRKIASLHVVDFFFLFTFSLKLTNSNALNANSTMFGNKQEIEFSSVLPIWLKWDKKWFWNADGWSWLRTTFNFTRHNLCAFYICVTMWSLTAIKAFYSCLLLSYFSRSHKVCIFQWLLLIFFSLKLILKSCCAYYYYYYYY